ncbi:hypothetical protein P12x_005428 [Tundrisphaera lichenicola]|uniref:hypothetical protein n=1 Tax=Tundrisphaera lichenicola TaxID=2029860 RepID=UPI003EBF3042
MAQIRRELHEDVRGVVEGAEAATDWRRYVRNYPMASIGLALAVGYLVVPRRRQTVRQITAAPFGESRELAEPVRVIEREAEKKGKGLLGTAIGFFAPMALRAAQGYALQYAEQWLAQHMAQQFQNHPDLAAAFGGHAEPPPAPTNRPPTAPRY